MCDRLEIYRRLAIKYHALYTKSGPPDDADAKLIDKEAEEVEKEG